ncbi:ABC transporter ATP-binding protein [Marinobacterium sediminicola]|uniref:ABC transport system ATP-binding protein n=1 Tax=Marinobacterium sediminicola TaxID=518898 RepID=A0ABY1RWM5_9GAMM|nr:ABC transporter ATP-binding protein [Marinobacterium sediminicola]ULG70282.1 ABC transporter ATP-binding protein [Marinobacterium sediminicola]SMR69860.1 putative ABC transport system ATP-binding protein [Marinobacterium sediminicola]
MSSVLRLKSLRFAWPNQAPILMIDQLELGPGDHLLIQGPSGSGKTTLLNLISGLQPGYDGTLEVAGQNLASMSSRALDRFRADQVGMLFQQFNLLPYLNLIDNVTLPCSLSALRRHRAGINGQCVEQEAERLLTRLQLDPALFRQRKVTELSIGQQQRVAAARALIGRPSLLIADEPTSALDTDSRDHFMQLLFEELNQSNTTLLMVSHDPALAKYFAQRLFLGRTASC